MLHFYWNMKKNNKYLFHLCKSEITDIMSMDKNSNAKENNINNQM